MDNLDSCSTTRTLVILLSSCERFPLVFAIVVPISAGGSKGNTAFGTVFGAGYKNGEVEPRFKVYVLSGLKEWAGRLSVSMSFNCKPTSTSTSARLLKRMCRKKAIFLTLPVFSVPSYREFVNCVNCVIR